MPNENYDSIGVRPEVGKELRKLQGEIQSQDGKRLTFTDLLSLLIKTYRDRVTANHDCSPG